MACAIHDCLNCVRANSTFILSEDYQLLQPSKFILRPSAKRITNNTAAFNLETELVYVANDKLLKNPSRVTFEICFFQKTKRELSHLTRRLMEFEQAKFTQNNMSIIFKDPILTLPGEGRVILRSPDFEHILSVPDDFTIVIPFEFLAFKTTINVIYLHPRGLTVSGNLHVTGKSICQLRQCLFCREAFHTISCWPKYFQYLFYGALIISGALVLWCIKTAIRSLMWTIKFISLFIYNVFRLLRLTARSSMLLGAFFGNVLRRTLLSSYEYLELNAYSDARFSTSSLVLLALSLLFVPVTSDCSASAIIQSDLKSCETLADGSQMCQLYTTAELTLPALQSESCIWFTDKNGVHLFSLKIQLKAVTCSFHTSRQYFTFPVTAKHISQVSCIYNEYCGQGVHCIKQKLGTQGLKFEAESPESRDFPGISSCAAGGLGVGCTILTRAACNFRRTWFEPDLLNSYEVSTITGHDCTYHVQIQHIENNTVTSVALTDSAYTPTGVKVSLIGAFDQPQLHISDSFIQRVGRPSEGFLAPASRRNHPKAGEIGAVQANSSYTKMFIFDPEISSCDFFEDSLRCIPAPDAITNLKATQEYALPLQKDLHLFQIQDGKLTSSLVATSAIRVQLLFANYRISVQTITVCPVFDTPKFEITGCYNCPLLARMTFKAHSSCQPGVVFVELQSIQVHTKAIQLLTEPSKIVIKFLANQKCFTEKICLRAQTIIQCQALEFCLNEPSIELLQINTNYTRVSSIPTSSGWMNWLRLPGVETLFYVKFLGSTLFIICILITIISTLVTCCCRKY